MTPSFIQRLDENEQKVNRRLASGRQSIEHIFALHAKVFGLFSIPKRFKLLVHGLECRKMVLNSFLLLNCHVCFNESPNNFNIIPPTIEDYLPLDEVMKPAPIVSKLTEQCPPVEGSKSG